MFPHSLPNLSAPTPPIAVFPAATCQAAKKNATDQNANSTTYFYFHQIFADVLFILPICGIDPSPYLAHHFCDAKPSKTGGHSKVNSLLEIAMFGFEPSLNQSQSIGGESVGQ